MIVPGEKIVVEESEESEDTDTASIGDIGESLSSDSSMLSPASPAHTRSYGKAKKTKDREPFYKGYKGEGVVYPPGDINGFAKSSLQVTPQSGTNLFTYWTHCLD